MPDTNTVIVPSSNVQGNITSCKIDTEQIDTHVNSLFSLKEMDTYRSYNTCNQQTIKEYTVPTFTAFGVIASLAVVFLIFATLSFLSFIAENN